MSSLIQNLSFTLEAMKKEDTVVAHKSADIKILEEDFINQVKHRCLKIKQRNTSILLRSINTKGALSELMHHSRKVDPVKNTVLHDRQEKIKRLKTELTNKLHNIKINSDKKVDRNSRNQSAQQQPLKIVLKEMRDGVEMLQIESMKAREEMALLVQRLTRDLRGEYY